MEGFGVHTFRLVATDGQTTLVKFHWKPAAGVHSLVWEEAQLASGVDPDFHRRDLADAIESGAHPSWDLGIQTFPDTEEQTFEGIDLLDPTKIVPEELAPVQVIGTMTLNANPTNFFAETEQVAFHTGHLVPGIDITDDPLLAARNFSYLDTQLTRLGGPNFAQIPINRPHMSANDMLRDGFHLDAVHAGVAPYHPNSLDGGCPFMAGDDVSAYVESPVVVPTGRKVRTSPASETASVSFDDHFTQPRMFYRSLTPVEQAHIAQAYTFELGKCYESTIRERMLGVLAQIDTELCSTIAAGLGLPAPESPSLPDVEPSPALSQVGNRWPTVGRTIGIVVDAGTPLSEVRAARDTIAAGGMVPLIVAPHGGTIDDGSGDPVTVQRTFLTDRSVEFDAVLVAAAPAPAADADEPKDAKAGEPVAETSVGPRVTLLLAEAYRHAKAIGAWGDSRNALAAAGFDPAAPGVVTDEDAGDVLDNVVGLLAEHRVWDRFPAR
jgi:catalase